MVEVTTYGDRYREAIRHAKDWREAREIARAEMERTNG